MTTDAWGIDDGYHDVHDRWCPTDPAIAAELRRSMGADDGEEAAPPAGRDVRVVRTGEAVRLDEPAELRLEDGTVLKVADQLPPDLPLGYHDLRRLNAADDERPTRLIATPGRCHLPADLLVWGL